jgi:hypothetical protein
VKKDIRGSFVSNRRGLEVGILCESCHVFVAFVRSCVHGVKGLMSSLGKGGMRVVLSFGVGGELCFGFPESLMIGPS